MAGEKPLFPCFSTGNAESAAVVSQLPQCSSYKQQETIEDSDDSEKIIDLSDSSDSSVIEIEKPQKEKKKSKKRKHKKAHKNKKRHEKEDSTKSDTRDNSYLNYLPKGRAIFRDDIPNLRAEDAYRLDRHPDKNNLAFEKLYERYVPKYSRKMVINLNREGKPRPNEHKSKIKRYYSKEKSTDSKSIFIYPSVNTFSEISDLDYIRVASTYFPEVQSKDSVTFQSLQSDTSKSIGPESFPSSEQLILALTKEFNRNLNEEKTNVEMWVDFIRFQDLVFHNESKLNGPSNSHSFKLCVEKKLDICNKALELNRKSVKLNLLRMKLLTLCSDELQKECSEIDSEWKRLCFLFPNAPQIWFEWIYYSLRCERMINFRANSRTKKIFKQGFGSLSKKLLEGQFQSHRIEIKHLELILVEMTLFLAEFFSSIDQTEKAIGIFQALIEFNLYTPDNIDFENSFEDWFILFEQFWDSGVSRIGEFSHPTDSDWRFFQSQITKGLVETVKIKDEQNLKVFGTQEVTDQCEDQIISEIRNSVVKENDRWMRSLCWLHLERMRHSLHWLPANVSFPIHHSMEDIEDPERVVLSDDDIKPFLYRLRQDDSKFYLSIKFLQFLGVPLVTYALDSAVSSSYFEWEYAFDSSFFLHDSECSLNPIHKMFEISKKFEPRFPNFSEKFVLERYGLENIGDGDYGHKVPLCDEIVKHYDRVWSRSRQAFIDNVFEKLCNRFNENHQHKLSLYCLWAQYKIELFRRNFIKEKGVKKFFKEILEKTSDIENLDLYNVFCGFMIQTQDSPNVYCETINTYEKLKPNTLNILRIKLNFVRDSLRLDSCLHQFIKGEKFKFKSAAEESSKISLAQSVLVKTFLNDHQSSSCKNAISQIESLWIQRHGKNLEEIQAIALLFFLEDKFEKAADFLEQQLLPDSLDSVNFVTRLKLDESVKKLAIERSIHVLYLQLMVHQYSNPNCKKPISLGRLRVFIDRALSTFPDDPVFLATLARIETNFNVLTRSRKFFNDYISNTKTVIQNYLVKRYLNQVEEGVHEQPNLVSLNSMYNIFMSTLHSELLILDKATTGTDDSSFDFHTGMANRIRNLFERALNFTENGNKSVNWLLGRSLSHCPTIWRLFFRFEEAELRRKERSTGHKIDRNSSMIYRALQMCPNHKPLYLDAVILEPNMLQECVDIMMDKQLRVRTAIEEVDLFLSAVPTTDKNAN